MWKRLTVLVVFSLLLALATLGAAEDSSLSPDDFEYTLDGGEVTITGYTVAPVGHVTIPREIDENPVVAIGDSAFSQCESMASITLPDTLKRIGDGAFSQCKGLSIVDIPDGVTHIGEYAFDNCVALTVILPKSVSYIGYAAFNMWGEQLALIVQEGSYAEQYAMENNEPYYYDLAASLPQATGSAGAWRYNIVNGGAEITTYGSAKPTGAIVIPEELDGNPVTGIGDNAFLGCTGITSVTIPSSVTRIGDNAFNACSGMTSVSIPDSVTTIGIDAFSACDSLTSVRLPKGITSIEEGTFFSCVALTDIIIPDGVTSIGQNAFNSCYSLSDLTIPEGVTSIGSRAFWNNEALVSVTLPASVTNIANEVFGDCTSLSTITVAKGSYGEQYARALKVKVFYMESSNAVGFAEQLAKVADGEIAEVTIDLAACSPVALAAAYADNPLGVYWILAQDAVPIEPVLRYFEEAGGLTKPKPAEESLSFTVAKDFLDQWGGEKTITVPAPGLDVKALTVPAESLLPILRALEAQWGMPSGLSEAFAQDLRTAYWNLAGDGLPAAPLFRCLEGRGLTKPTGERSATAFTVAKDYAAQWSRSGSLRVAAEWTNAKTMSLTPTAMLALLEAISMEWFPPPLLRGADLMPSNWDMQQQQPHFYVEYVSGQRYEERQTIPGIELTSEILYQSEAGICQLMAHVKEAPSSWGEYWEKGAREHYELYSSDEPRLTQGDSWFYESREQGWPYLPMEVSLFEDLDITLVGKGEPILGLSTQHYQGTDHNGRAFQLWIDDKHHFPVRYVFMDADGVTLHSYKEITALSLGDPGLPTPEEAWGKLITHESDATMQVDQWAEVLASFGGELITGDIPYIPLVAIGRETEALQALKENAPDGALGAIALELPEMSPDGSPWKEMYVGVYKNGGSSLASSYDNYIYVNANSLQQVSAAWDHFARDWVAIDSISYNFIPTWINADGDESSSYFFLQHRGHASHSDVPEALLQQARFRFIPLDGTPEDESFGGFTE